MRFLQHKELSSLECDRAVIPWPQIDHKKCNGISKINHYLLPEETNSIQLCGGLNFRVHQIYFLVVFYADILLRFESR